MKCLLISHGKLVDFKSMDELASVPFDEAFVIDVDAILNGHFNFKLYNELSKYIEFTLMAYPNSENDLVDIIISGASRVVINDKLEVKTIQRFLDITEEIIMKCKSEQNAILFHSLTGNMYLSCKTYDIPGVFFYYGPFMEQGPNIISLEGFPSELKEDC